MDNLTEQIDEIQRSAPELYKMLHGIVVEGIAITNAAQLINNIQRNILETSCVDHVERTIRWNAISPKKELITASYVDSTGVWTEKAVGCAHWDLCSEIQVLSDYSFAMYETLEALLAGSTTVEESAHLLADVHANLTAWGMLHYRGGGKNILTLVREPATS